MPDGKRYYYEYLYLSSMIGTIVGFGDIIAKRNIFTKFLIISEVITLICEFSILCLLDWLGIKLILLSVRLKESKLGVSNTISVFFVAFIYFFNNL